MIDELGREGVTQLMWGHLYTTEHTPPPQLIAYPFIAEQFSVVEPQVIIGRGRPLQQVALEAMR